jgi:hypothetical protein
MPVVKLSELRATAFCWDVAGLQVSASRHGVRIKGQSVTIQDVETVAQLLRVAESVWHDLACGVGAVAVKRRLTRWKSCHA